MWIGSSPGGSTISSARLLSITCGAYPGCANTHAELQAEATSILGQFYWGSADPPLSTAEIFGIPIEINGRRRYAGGLLPVGDAFLAWARSMPPDTSRASSYDRVIPQWWRLPFHAVSLLIMTLLVVAAVRAAR